MQHRRDIDGLRALAVLPVVAYHAGVHGFTGGYVGVDIFFVISGYLITAILLGEVQTGSFSIAGFYRRRVLRLFPALAVLLVVCTAVFPLILLPSEVVSYGRSVAATALFSSNFLFLNETDYFGLAALQKPLLHTWSLAVEEQYYIIWPVVLWALHRYLPQRLRLAVVLMTLASLAVSIVLVQASPSQAFYLLPSRAWELTLGSMLAVGAVPAIRSRLTAQILGGLGVAMILVSIRMFTADTPFPGYAALMPCLGAVLIIATGQHQTMVARVLSHPVAGWFGRISYSLYLWHWPVIVFFRLALYLPLTPATQVAIFVTSTLLAWASCRFVEQPFRHGISMPTPALLGRAIAAIAVLVIAGNSLNLAHGLPGRFSPEEQRVASYIDYDGDHLYRGGRCFMVDSYDRYDAATCLHREASQPSILLLGDSHAADLWPGLSVRAPGANVMEAAFAGCRPIRGLFETAHSACGAFMRSMMDGYLPKHRVDVLILAGRWVQSDLPLLPETLAYARTVADHVVLVGPVPQYQTALPRLLVRGLQLNEARFPDAALMPQVFDVDRGMQEVASRAGVRFVSLVDGLCSGRHCTAYAGRVPLQFDYGHLTREGSTLVAGLLASNAATPAAASLRATAAGYSVRR